MGLKQLGMKAVSYTVISAFTVSLMAGMPARSSGQDELATETEVLNMVNALDDIGEFLDEGTRGIIQTELEKYRGEGVEATDLNDQRDNPLLEKDGGEEKKTSKTKKAEAKKSQTKKAEAKKAQAKKSQAKKSQAKKSQAKKSQAKKPTVKKRTVNIITDLIQMVKKRAAKKRAAKKKAIEKRMTKEIEAKIENKQKETVPAKGSAEPGKPTVEFDERQAIQEFREWIDSEETWMSEPTKETVKKALDLLEANLEKSDAKSKKRKGKKCKKRGGKKCSGMKGKGKKGGGMRGKAKKRGGMNGRR